MKIVFNEKKIDICVLAVLMFSASALYTVETSMIYILITGICAIYVCAQTLKRLSIIQSLMSARVFWWVTVFLLFIVIDAAIRTQYGEMNFDFIFFTWLSIVIVLLVLLKCKTTQDLLSIFCYACEIAAIALCLYVLVSEGGRSLREDGRLGDALSGNVITVSMHLGLYSFGILHLFLSTRKKKHLIAYVICCVFMLLTGSKVSLFYFFCAAVYYLKNCPPNKKVKRFLFLFVIAILVGILIFANQRLYNVIGKRIVEFLGSLGMIDGFSYSYSTSTRLFLIELSFRLFLENPIIGGGFNTVAALPPYYVYSHVNYLELLANNGIIGFILYYGFYLSKIAQIRRYKKKDNNMLFLGTLLFSDLLRDITQITYTAGWVCYGAMILVSVYIITYKKERHNENQSKIKNNSPAIKG